MRPNEHEQYLREKTQFIAAVQNPHELSARKQKELGILGLALLDLLANVRLSVVKTDIAIERDPLDFLIRAAKLNLYATYCERQREVQNTDPEGMLNRFGLFCFGLSINKIGAFEDVSKQTVHQQIQRTGGKLWRYSPPDLQDRYGSSPLHNLHRRRQTAPATGRRKRA